LQQAAGVEAQTAQRALDCAGYEVKPALVMLLAGVDAPEARERLAAADGRVRDAIH
jgi:N-acetylmuramic acid 6-phosphate etherase